MSDSTDDPTLFAAEYALGCLDLADMREAEAQAARDPAFAAEIVNWQARLGALHMLVPPVTPPAILWSRLALATGIGKPARPSGRAFWQASTAGSLAIAASLALFAFLPRPPGQPTEPARFAAALSPLATPAKFMAEARPDGAIAITSLDGAPAPSGRAYQLWALPQGAAVPVSLGLLTPGTQVVTPPARASAQEQLLVSDEPAGGSTTGGPTGAVLFGGRLVPISPAATPGR
ncbi:anti-sigma factor domain-containing protein [Acidisphaera sp. L21]|jgi:anti-sigma-K factor RskA|uniref:anti-sigma factor n=1 Tax=Acidisphaera sp. L21 TaxID=1641851 RepID=UPI00131E4FEF|nr:anti-sigma factor [Acidisphaera sp. L21]